MKLIAMKLFLLTIAISLSCLTANAQTPVPPNARIPASTQPIYHEKYRPQLHFSPQAHWMNDPNGLVYYKGIFHLFFQYYPDSSVWGPMHWGHAVSIDLVHWRQEPIALYPDSLGYIFSGSAVLDQKQYLGIRQGRTAPARGDLHPTRSCGRKPSVHHLSDPKHRL